MSFENFSKIYKNDIDRYLEYALTSRKNHTKDEFIKQCYSFIEEYSRNGKRLRPLSMILSYTSLKGENIKKIMPVAVSIELYHTYTLILDDLMDEDEFRRNNKTVYKKLKDFYIKKFDEIKYEGNLYNKKSTRFCISIAILIGNLTFNIARQLIHESEIDYEKKLKILYEIDKLDELMFQGQSMDVYNEALDIDEPKYLEIAALKTGVLFGISMKIASILAKSNENIQNSFLELGKKMALAFQIQDDILDLTKGKGHEIGSDIKKGKRTLIYIKAYEKNKDIKNIIGKENIITALKIFNDTKAIEYAKKKAETLANEAKEILKSLKLDKHNEFIFMDFMDFLISRNY